MSFFKNEFNKYIRGCVKRYAKKLNKTEDHVQVLFFLKETETGFTDAYKICVDYVPVKDASGRETEITIKDLLDISTIDFKGLSHRMPPVMVSILIGTAERLHIEADKLNVIASVAADRSVRLCAYNGKSTYVEDLTEESILELVQIG